MSDTAVSIGFIGLGVMGRSIAGRLMDSYSNMHIYSRRKESAALMLERGILLMLKKYISVQMVY